MAMPNVSILYSFLEMSQVAVAKWVMRFWPTSKTIGGPRLNYFSATASLEQFAVGPRHTQSLPALIGPWTKWPILRRDPHRQYEDELRKVDEQAAKPQHVVPVTMDFSPIRARLTAKNYQTPFSGSQQSNLSKTTLAVATAPNRTRGVVPQVVLCEEHTTVCDLFARSRCHQFAEWTGLRNVFDSRPQKSEDGRSFRWCFDTSLLQPTPLGGEVEHLAGIQQKVAFRAKDSGNTNLHHRNGLIQIDRIDCFPVEKLRTFLNKQTSQVLVDREQHTGVDFGPDLIVIFVVRNKSVRIRRHALNDTESLWPFGMRKSRRNQRAHIFGNCKPLVVWHV